MDMNEVTSFVGKNYKTLIIVAVGLFLLYWVIYVITPSVRMSDSEKSKIDSLNVVIQNLNLENAKLDSTIVGLNNKIQVVDKEIGDIKNKRTIVKKQFNEKINRVNTYTEPELDSFFSDRYQ
jgi:hypothetical protein